MSHASSPYITTVAHVRDVRLVGTADLFFWQQHLSHSNLFPYSENGTAHLVVSATDFVWQGFPVQEFVLSVVASLQRDASNPDGFYLAHAFNSSRLLSLLERTFFQTPYTHGQTHLTVSHPARISVSAEQRTVFQASMSSESVLLRQEDEYWEGRIFLPVRATRKRRSHPHFFAKLAGFCAIYPWTHADTLELHPGQDDTALYSLISSNFQATEWRIRGDALHARSKTYQSYT